MIKHYSLLLTAAAAVLTLFGSCRTRYVYETPLIDPEGLFRDDPEADTITVADIPWPDYFADPHLVALIAEGLENNSDLRVAYARIRSAEADLAVSRGAFFPTVHLVAQAGETLLSTGSNGKKIFGYHSEQYSLGIASAWEADIWGKLAHRNRAQYAAFLSSWEYKNLIRTSLIANIATSYYSLLALDEQLRVSRESAELLYQTTQTMEALMEAGMQTGAAVQQSRALWYGTLATIPDLESNIRQAENALSVLIGRTPGPIERSSLQQIGYYSRLDHGIPMQMLARRPDVRQAELAFRRAFELTSAARASFYPSLSLSNGSLIGCSSTGLSHFFRPENLIADIIGQLSAPVFNQNQIRANLQTALANQDEALIDFGQTILTAAQEVSDILYGFYANRTKSAYRQIQIESLQTSVEFTQELLVAGELNYTEVLTAQQDLLSALLDDITDQLQLLQYTVTLYRALGGGLE